MHMIKRLYYTLALVTLFMGAGLSVNAQNGASNQFIEMENGTTDISYPLRIESPQGKECGGGKLDRIFPDKVLVYSTPDRGRSNPDNIKLWSNLWYVRTAVSLGYGGKLAGSGLKTPTTRVCVGAAGRFLSVSDYRYIYLWRRVLIAGRP